MDFQKRLEKAIERGTRLREERLQAEAKRALSEEELRRLHSQFRLPLSEHVEGVLRELPSHFPGFRYSSVMNDRGWGAVVSRDDFGAGADGRRASFYSRLEMTVRPFASIGVLELTAKGTVRNKELFNRGHYQKLDEVDIDSFIDLCDLWVVEYAQLYAAQR